jgi:uncharacterized protein
MKKNKNLLTQPLSAKELEWLENHLTELSQIHDDCMTLEMVDGLFCALIINPVMAKPTEWMKIVFGQKHEFKSDANLEKNLNVLARYWNQQSLAIENHGITEQAAYIPFVKDSQTHQLAQAWATGFSIGMDYCAEAWKKLSEEEENRSLLAPFIALKQGYLPEKENEALTNEQRAELLATIPAAAHTLFHYWVEKTQSASNAPKAKVGRNDPCPCGSGKKYKKCCESKESVAN